MFRSFWAISIIFLSIFTDNNSLAAINGDYHENSGNVARGFDAKNVLTSLASSLMSRGFTTTGTGSQVISLNITNLLILVLLKAMIFAAASLAGHKGGGDHFARTADNDVTNDKFLTDEEILMFLSYLTGQPGNNGCLQNIACHQPLQAKKYVNAGDLLLKAAKLMTYGADDTYDYVIKEVDRAANVGIAGGDCHMFKCDNSAR